MNKTQPLLATVLVAAVALTGCGTSATASAPGQPEKLELRYQGSANNVSLPELAEDLGYFGQVKLKWVGNTISGPQDIQSAATDQTDFGGAFTGAVVKLIEAGAPVKAVINYYGSDDKTFLGFYVKEDSPIRTPRDLIGKKVAVNTVGANLEAVLDTWLLKNGLTQAETDQVQLVVLPPVNTEQALRNGQVDVGALNGILQDHAAASGGLRRLVSDVEAFGPYNGGPYVLRTDFIKKYPETSKIFVSAVAKAIEWERTTPREEVIARFTKIIQNRHRNESTDTLKYWKSVGITHGGLISDQDYTLWEGWLKQSGFIKSDKIDTKKLYTNEFNPYAGSK
ncbi:ABC-type nitrate/sulfonate/bicarbonate transport system, substrate-binding protein [Amycolatopsis xylanica]|uniref:ABC-type nitrate/sulfonate/bicarbonate transport system, substrate-binding protein n=1 Tax=Amycolatopsis xylanica TaxID=589385 RepID=A0A1H3HPF3_9PSEU|nr:ABC transporter substrate-binding protein [Amycolatopsis xylanica]SDY17260.1 ABC-type nitrate/sulfonate/bicarbonate transport system, substrate-binding protein [Amycolatopsis xylanica]